MGNERFDALPVHVAIDAKTLALPAGQLGLLALANQLARVHRRISFSLPSSSAVLCIPYLLPRSTVGETLLTLVRSIDPCGDFTIGTQTGPRVSIGLGADLPEQFDWYIGADRALGSLSLSPREFSSSSGTLLGAAVASCLGAAAILRSVVGLESSPRTVSCWNYGEGECADTGPREIAPFDVGRILMVGAGAVAAAVVHWLLVFGIGSEWTIVDRDQIELHNTNRGLMFMPSDAGWPRGTSRSKAELLASFIPGSRWEPDWYHEAKLVECGYDVVLGLANGHNVRHHIASRNTTVTLQATTGRNWLSQLHRHITGRDDCIWCRAGEVAEPIFGCSTGEIPAPPGERTDAALPFLSAASGLMLATALQRLQSGELAADDCNDWRWDFGSTHRMSSSGFRKCRDTCSRTLPAAVRREMNRENRWRFLDPEG
jgi:hypothetical protein